MSDTFYTHFTLVDQIERRGDEDLPLQQQKVKQTGAILLQFRKKQVLHEWQVLVLPVIESNLAPKVPPKVSYGKVAESN